MTDPRKDPELAAAWRTARESLKRSLPGPTFRMWIEPLKLTGANAEAVFLVAPTNIAAWVERRYIPLVESALSNQLGRDTAVRITSDDQTQTDGADPGPPATALNPSYTFERFVIGDANRVAHAAALTVAEAPAEAYNPLFIHGPPGLGKTHLLSAIANYLSIHAPELNVRYTTAEGFTQEFVSALKGSGVERFKTLYRDLDVLLVDDIQFLQGKQTTEDEFFHTFNALYEAGSQVVLSADRLPVKLSSLADRLRDRFEWGFVVSIAAPTLATRQTIVERLVREAGLEVTDRAALSTLAQLVDANVRQLHGGLTRIIAHASLTSSQITTGLVQQVLGRESPNQPQKLPQPVDLERILDASASVFQASVHQIIDRRRSAKAIDARQAVVLLAREQTTLSLAEIGRRLNRDHSTVHTSLRRAEEKLDNDASFTSAINRIRSRIHESQEVVDRGA